MSKMEFFVLQKDKRQQRDTEAALRSRQRRVIDGITTTTPSFREIVSVVVISDIEKWSEVTNLLYTHMNLHITSKILQQSTT